jgi:hypothetical protein
MQVGGRRTCMAKWTDGPNLTVETVATSDATRA